MEDPWTPAPRNAPAPSLPAMVAVTDLPPMDPCPAHRRGRHELDSIVPDGDYPSDVTLYCISCGAVRRFSASGPMLASRLDDADAETIARTAVRIATMGGAS